MSSDQFTTSADAAGRVAHVFTHTINGLGVGSSESEAVINPASGQGFAFAPLASPAQIEAAIAAARAATRTWAATPIAQRGERLRALAAALRANADELSVLLTREQGKPLPVARAEIMTAADFIDGITELQLQDEDFPPYEGGKPTRLSYRPLGVVVGITPWNVPIVLASHKISQALFAGNTLVLKPSPYTPLTTLRLGELSRDILPPGVLNVVSGGNEVGEVLTSHPGVDRISFTGSTPTGKRIIASAAPTLKRLTLELGGNDPAIILPDADLDRRLPMIFASAFRLCGQVCMGIKRIYAPAARYEEICARLAAMAEGYRVGDGLEAGTQMGPLQNRMQFEKVLGLLDETRAVPGVRILSGGRVLDRPGYFIAPTVVAGLPESARLVVEEQFGPLVPVQPYASLEEVIALANDTRMGLSASIWTEDPAGAQQIAARLEAGTVWINRHVNADPHIPFGGFKESGVGREHGLMGLRSFTEPQVVDIG